MSKDSYYHLSVAILIASLFAYCLYLHVQVDKIHAQIRDIHTFVSRQQEFNGAVVNDLQALAGRK